ncbi:MAG: enoyl-CoA hydratase/isomerase family protein [Legionellaceae bacterium]|nr:enoyl-CoA hydratase/isomerase family protein [Legionellaceae bacterium]
MSDLHCHLEQQVMHIYMARLERHNAFDDVFLQTLQDRIKAADANPEVRVIVLKAEGRHFSAGADLNWMQRMREYSETENFKDSMVLANTMAALYDAKKPTIAVVQGCAYGGGAGLVAACDIAIAEENARFCFSEVKLGLIPAVISPYVIEAIGPRAAKALFMSAEPFDASRALQLGLIQHCVPHAELYLFADTLASKLTMVAPLATQEVKTLVKTVNGQVIDEKLRQYTAHLIAKKRVSAEGQLGICAFVEKQALDWSQRHDV